jgi:hypothetical protein
MEKAFPKPEINPFSTNMDSFYLITKDTNMPVPLKSIDI